MKRQDPNILPVNQRDLAAYLGVSATLLSMTITGRHGSRELGAAPFRKLANIWLAYQQAQKQHIDGSSPTKPHESSPDGRPQIAKVMLKNAAYAQAHLPVLRRRLDEMLRMEQRYIHWKHSLELLLSGLPPTRDSATDRGWLQSQQKIVIKRLQATGLHAQVKLQLQIEMEKARVRVYRAMAKQLLKK